MVQEPLSYPYFKYIIVRTTYEVCDRDRNKYKQLSTEVQRAMSLNSNNILRLFCQLWAERPGLSKMQGHEIWGTGSNFYSWSWSSRRFLDDPYEQETARHRQYEERITTVFEEMHVGSRGSYQKR